VTATPQSEAGGDLNTGAAKPFDGDGEGDCGFSERETGDVLSGLMGRDGSDWRCARVPDAFVA
jgi:hypothetical protein